jgi:AcrR family transcriptional regulator
MELFGEKGFADVLIEDVGARAAVGKGSIYREFGSKEALYTEAVIEGFRHLRERIKSALRQPRSIADGLGAIVRQATEYFWDHREFFTLLHDPTALPPTQLKRFRRERARLALLISRVLRDGAAKGLFRDDLDFRLVAESILGMIRGIRRHRTAEVTQDEAVETVMALFLQGYLVDSNADGADQTAPLALNSAVRRGPRKDRVTSRVSQPGRNSYGLR